MVMCLFGVEGCRVVGGRRCRRILVPPPASLGFREVDKDGSLN